MKKLLSVLLVLSMISCLVACGEKNVTIDEQQDIDQNSETLENDEVETLEHVIVKSTEDSIIMSDETGTEMVFKFDGEQIISLSIATEVETEEEAELAKELYSAEDLAEICTVSVEGKTVIMEYTPKAISEMFGGETRTTVEAELVNEGYTIIKE